MSSGGGIMDLDAARRMPVRTILSGPPGGVAGALWIAQARDSRTSSRATWAARAPTYA
jgi:N-methylhydantoinase A/oxoprolinase/acetone carboxylase beta subunit